jgi:2-methylcitrate dehydratase PrpD
MAINTQVKADHKAPAITQILANYISSHPSNGWDDSVEHEAHRTFLNWLGCAIGAATHESVDAALHAIQELDPTQQASILGRKEKVDMCSAALINGISSHTFDFDDTHLKTIIHPAGPVASAILALSEKTKSSGREMIDALVIGIDVACRIGNCMYPDHYDRGWHITGSTGTVGAAAACARLLKLDKEKTAMAIGIAASQPVGMREQFGTMTKPFHPGGAASAGLRSALLAKHGFTASAKALEAPRGMIQTISTKCDWSEITDELGKRFEISFNAYKPFACGIVIHPSIDACAQLKAKGVKPEDVQKIELRVHSLVLELTGKKTPADGLQAKFSVYHGCAAGLMYGKAGEEEFLDHIVTDPKLIELRDKVNATVDDSIHEASADVTAYLKNGEQVHIFVKHAIGSLENPMTDKHLEEKFHNLSDPIVSKETSDKLIKLCWDLAKQDNMANICQVAQGK